MLRVLQIVSRLSRNTGVMGFLMNYYRRIDTGRIQFDFLYFMDEDQDLIEEIHDRGGRVFKIQRPAIGRGTLCEARTFFREHEGEFAIVHNHEVYLTFLFSRISKANGTKAFVSHSHTTKLSPRFTSRIRNEILCIPVNRLSDYRLACSDAAGKALFHAWWGKSHSAVVPNAIDCGRFSFCGSIRDRMRRELGLEGRYVVGNVGRLEAGKNHKKLLEVFASICERISDCTLLVLGEGNLQCEIEDRAEELGVRKHIRFLGKKADIENYYQAMDIFVYPSLYEGLGIALIEAQCMGLPCIASTGVPETVKINNNFRFLSPDASAAFWAEAALQNRIREEHAVKNIRESGYDISFAAPKLVEMYELIANGEEICETSFWPTDGLTAGC